jgi:hypothetical protein
MPDLRRRNCMACGRPDSEVGPISWRGNCRPCGLAAEEQAITQLAEHRGPVFNYWRAKTVAGILASTSDTSR